MNLPTPADMFLKDASAYKQFLRVFLGIILVNALLVIAATLATPNFDVARLPRSIFVIAIIIISWRLLDTRPRHATLVLVGGLWLLMAFTTSMFAGIHSANMMMYPFLVALSGWVLGKRWLVTLTLATLGLMVLVAVAELLGLLHPTPRAPVLLALALHVGTLVACSFLVHIAYTNFRQRSSARIQQRLFS